jgi:hypothetical protein
VVARRQEVYLRREARVARLGARLDVAVHVAFGKGKVRNRFFTMGQGAGSSVETGRFQAMGQLDSTCAQPHLDGLFREVDVLLAPRAAPLRQRPRDGCRQSRRGVIVTGITSFGCCFREALAMAHRAVAVQVEIT